MTHESSICIVCFDDTVVTEAKAQNHSRCSAMFKKQWGKKLWIYNFKTSLSFLFFYQEFVLCVLAVPVKAAVRFQLCFVTVACTEGLKTKLSTHFSFDCNSFFLYHIFIGHNDILWGKKNQSTVQLQCFLM